jgi:hypothetical protein
LSSAVGLALAAYAQQQMQGQMAPMKGETAMPTTTGSLRVVSPASGARITTTDMPVRVAVSNFRVSEANVGRPDVPNEGHIHIMVDGMTMGSCSISIQRPISPCRGGALHRVNTP